MELDQLIAKLKEERVKLDQTLATLERLEQAIADAKPFLKQKRGRKFMDEAGRKEVSERMKKYWSNRRRSREGAKDSDQNSR